MISADGEVCQGGKKNFLERTAYHNGYLIKCAAAVMILYILLYLHK